MVKLPAMIIIVNEHIASTLNTFLPIYKLFFNAVFDSGLVPEEWLVGIIKPIYKNKGDPTSPENYQPITLLSCLGQGENVSPFLFSLCINDLENYLVEKKYC